MEKLTYELSEDNLLNMLNDTSSLISQKDIQQLQMLATAYKTSNALTGKIEFWKWMNRNFNGVKGNMFSSNQAMKTYMSMGQGKASWMAKQIQGKGYEWDWMQKQRSSIKNIFKVYEAGDVSNQAAIDVIERGIFSDGTKKYQMKAYSSKNIPDLHNTGKDVIVVTNREKVAAVNQDGYTAQSFKQQKDIIKDVDSRLNDIEKGTATPSYSIKNIGGAMTKAGIVGCAVGICTESIGFYESWKKQEITDEQYLEKILDAGGDVGITSALTTGIMIPVSATVTAVGASAIITLPIAFAVNETVNKIVAPCFKRGNYRNILEKAYYYQSLENMYSYFMQSIENASNEYEHFIGQYIEQEQKYEFIKEKDRVVTAELKKLYDSI